MLNLNFSDFIRDSPVTQKEISMEIFDNGISEQQTTVSKILKDMECTLKRLLKMPIERNSINNI